MGVRLRSWWQKIKQHPVAAVLTALLVVVIVLVVLSVLGYIFNWNWTGLGSYIPPTKASNFQRGKTIWDWLQLLIIPAVLAVGGYLFNYTTSRNEQKASVLHNQTEREIASDHQREAALQAYIDKMSELLLHEKLRESEPHDEVRKIARIRTLTVLNLLDGKRKGSVLQFLKDSELINRGTTIINLFGANLSGAILSKAFLNGVDLVQVDLSGANLRQANLGYIPSIPPEDQEYIEGADLSGANLSEANMSEAYLDQVNLRRANLTKANLSGADLDRADLRYADLTDADLSYAKLMSADLSYANLTGADLTNTELSLYTEWENGFGADLSKSILKGVTGITIKELEKRAESLKGAIMPDGSIHP